MAIIHDNAQDPAAFLSAVLEHLAEGVVACNADGVLTTFNRATREFHGLPESPIPASEWANHYQLYLADGHTLMKTEEIPLFRALAGERVQNVEMVIFANGRIRTVLCNGEAIFDARGKKLGAVVAMHDITEMKNVTKALQLVSLGLEERVLERTSELQRANEDLSFEISEREKAEEALGDSEKRFRTLFEQSPLSVQLLSVEGRTTQVNSAWKKLWGMSDNFVEDFILKEYNILDDPQLVTKNIMPVIQAGFDGTAGKIPAIYYDPNETALLEGVGRWVEAHINPIFDETGAVREVVLIHQDVSDKVLFEKEINAAKDAAEQANRLKSSFLANMSHEIRTPLGAILGFSELLKDPSLGHEERLKYLEIIGRSGKALTSLIDDILDLSKVEAGRLHVEQVPVDVDALVSDVTSLLKVQSAPKNLKIEIESSSRQSHTRSDPVRLRQILINLVGNAVKFTQAGSVIVKIDRTNSDRLIIKVSDTGIGIPDDLRSSLFQPFNQIDNSRTRKFGGTGLGLALSKRLAQAMDGDVYLESTVEGSGSVFVVDLPLGKLSVNAGTTEKSQSFIPPVSVKRLALDRCKILVVDDSDDNRMLVQHVLEKKGAQVKEARNGAEGLQQALAERFDVILMDVQMPVMDGLEAISLLRSSNCATPIIALTAHAMAEERDQCLAQGANAHVSKPVDFDELSERIQNLVENANISRFNARLSLPDAAT